MNEESKKRRLAQWKALPIPKMSWETFKRMISMSPFKDVPEKERPGKVLVEWLERVRWDEIENRIENRLKNEQGKS